MNLRPEEISSIIKEQIKNYENKVELTDTGSVLKVGDGYSKCLWTRKCYGWRTFRIPRRSLWNGS